MNYISMLDGIDQRYHRSPIIIHRDQWHIADFETVEQLDFFAETLGFTYELIEEKTWLTGMTYRKYAMSHEIDEYAGLSFWHKSDIPDGAKPIKALSNGNIVTCYYVNDGEKITIHRPNPNAAEVYKPLTLEQHLVHQRIYGAY